MKEKQIGNSDISASVLGLGTWAIGGAFWGGSLESESIKTIQAAINEGINLIDTAPAYGFGVAEEIVGKAIHGQRDKIIISSKCGLNWNDQHGTLVGHESGHDIYRYLGKEFIRKDLENSLRRLKTEYIDIYYTHWQDETTPLSEVMETLQQFKKEGKIRAIGASNATVETLKEYQALGGIDVGQEEYSLLHRHIEAEILPYCQSKNISMLAYCPLAQGLLAGKIAINHQFKEGDMRKSMESFSKENIQKSELLNQRLNKIAKKYDLTLAQLMIAWALARTGITHVLCGARQVGHILENVKAATVTISDTDLEAIRELGQTSGVTFTMYQ
jgi:methylglyoxal reductase